jgi:hypothetical protein
MCCWSQPAQPKGPSSSYSSPTLIFCCLASSLFSCLSHSLLHSILLPLGEVLTDNVLLVTASTDKKDLAGAIANRVREAAHTVLECYGSAAVTTAVQVRNSLYSCALCMKVPGCSVWL